MERLRQLIHEIHRRSLWQVLGIYVVASWAVLQVVDTLGGALRLPDWTEPFALVLLIVGLPIVLATAFVQEGISKSDALDAEAAPPGAAPASGLLTWRNALGGGVLAFALWGVVAAGWVLFGAATRAIPPADGAIILPSVAIMPCDDLSPTQDQEALAQGLAEEVSLALSGLDAIEKVIGRYSTVALKAEGADLATIASTLDVANVLNCTVARDRDQVRVTVQLNDAGTGSVLWSDGFDEPFTGLFAVYEVIARGVADGLQVVLAGGSETVLVAEATGNAGAHEAYLRGRFLWNQRTGESLRAAITEFGRAIGLDSVYAEAWSGLADSYVLVSEYSGSQQHRTAYRQALSAAERAVLLDGELGMAHTSLGYALYRTGDWRGAEAAFQRAMELSPGYATAHQWYGDFLSNYGRPAEGVAHTQRALELDPVSRVISRNQARALWKSGDAEGAIEQARQTVDLHPGFAAAWGDLSVFLLEVGAYEEGIDAWAAFNRVSSDAVPEAGLAAYRAAVFAHESGEAQVIADPYGGTWADYFYAQTGEHDVALSFLQELAEQGAYGNLAARHSFLGRLLGDDPRYHALIEEAGITW